MPEFFCEEIEVECKKKPGPPTSFRWRSVKYEITEIVEARRALDFQKSWWRRKHRDHYVVKTGTGETFKLYFHRGPGRRHWVLVSRL